MRISAYLLRGDKIQPRLLCFLGLYAPGMSLDRTPVLLHFDHCGRLGTRSTRFIITHHLVSLFCFTSVPENVNKK